MKFLMSKYFLTLFIFLVFFVYRLPSLAFTFINNDDHHWKTRGYAFSSALSSLDFAGTAPTYHPGVTLLWSQFFAIKTYGFMQDYGYTPAYFNLSEFMLTHYVQHIFIVLFTSILAAFLYKGLEIISGKKLALFFIVILIGEAFFTALARTIHLDVLLSMLIYNSIVFGYLGFSDLFGKKANVLNIHIILGGVFMGLALLTKSSALILFPWYLVCFFIALYFKNLDKRVLIKKSLSIFAIALVTFVIFWPAMWVNPINVLHSYFIDGIKGTAIDSGHEHVWFGVMTSNPGFWFYPLAILSRFSAVLVGTFVLGLYVFVKERQYKGTKIFDSFLFVNLVFFVLYFAMITYASKKMDRYELPLIFPIVIFSVNFYRSLGLSLKKFLALILFYCLSIFVIYFGFHPNYLAYYSPFVGGYEKGRVYIEPKWLVGYDKVADFFNSKSKASTIKVAIADLDYLKPMAKFQIIDINDDSKIEMADYLVLPVYRISKLEYYKERFDLDEPDDEIKVAGVTYYEIFKLKKVLK